MIFEFLIDKNLEEDNMINCFSQLFTIYPENILIIQDIYDINLKVTDQIKILCENTEIEGDFKLKLSIYLRSSDVENIYSNERQFAEDFCDFLKCKCLIDDENGVHPWATLLIAGKNKVSHISLDPNEEEKERYVLYKSSSDEE